MGWSRKKEEQTDIIMPETVEHLESEIRKLKAENEDKTDQIDAYKAENRELKLKDQEVQQKQKELLLLQEQLQKPETGQKEQKDKENLLAVEKDNIGDILNDLKSMIESIAKKLDNASDSLICDNRDLISITEKLENSLNDKQLKLENLVQSYQEDRAKKDRIKLINRCIYLSDLVRKTLYEFECKVSDKDLTDLEGFLKKQLEEVVTGIDEALKAEAIEVIRTGKQGGDFDVKMHNSIDIKQTDISDLDGKVYMSISPAYIWTLPYVTRAKSKEGEDILNYRFLLREEQVITYRYISDLKSK